MNIGLCFLMVCSPLFSGHKDKGTDLSLKYQEWLKITRYIILPEEREVFFQLDTDRERDLFIEAFWKQRDPTSGTPQNEYKEEHMRRFLYANTQLNRGTPREGWMTDMGRIYILLGPPVSRERYDSMTGLHPCQVWYYYGDKTKGLPTYFSVLFYQRSGSGEYKLYDPAADGPAVLLVEPEQGNVTNYQAFYKRIKELAPALAGPAVSMIPGQYPFNFQPSPQNTIILSRIYDLPKKNINANYATHFLHYKGVVSTEYLTNYVQNHTDIALIQDPIMNINFLHFSISPSQVSIDYFEPNDQYFCNYRLDVSVRNGEKIVLQYSKDFPFYFAPDNLDAVQGKGIAILDSFPLIEGVYQLNLLIQNSVGKEFSVFEREIRVPERTGISKIVGPVVGYQLQDYPSHLHVSFKVMDKQLLVDPQKTISPAEDVALAFSIMDLSRDLWEGGQVEVSVNGLQGKNPSRTSVLLDLKNYPFNDKIAVHHAIPASVLSPDYYEITLKLKDREGAVIDEKKNHVIVTSAEAVSHPITLSKSFPLANYYLFLYSLARQYDQENKLQKAESFYEKVYLIKPDYFPGIVEYARFLLKIGKFSKSLKMIENVKGSEQWQFDYYLIKGQAQMKMEKYFQAIQSLVAGNTIYNSDTRLLNSLGFCFYRTGDKKRALETLGASLALDPRQENIKTLIKEIEKNS
jgi:GWxTD domain-containing protein